MAPWVRSGHREKAMLAEVSISCMASATSHGNPPPPCSGANGTLPHPASTYRRYASAKPGGVDTDPVAGSRTEPTVSPR